MNSDTFPPPRSRRFLFALILSMLFAPSMAIGGEWTGDVNMALGFKVLEQKHWKPINKNGEAGFTFDIRKKSWPFALAADILWSRGQRFIFSHETGYTASRGQGYATVPPDQHGEVKVDTYQADVGIRKVWEQFGVIRPFIGAGPAWVRADALLKAVTVLHKHHGDGFGAWVSLGFYIVVDPRFNIAYDMRHSEVRIDMEDARDVGVGGQHYRLLLGYHW